MTTFSEAAHPRVKGGTDAGRFRTKDYSEPDLTLGGTGFIVRCERCQANDSLPGTFECATCTEPGDSAFFNETPPAKVLYEDPYPGRGADEAEFDPCDRCGGEGILEQFKLGADGGVCFKCNGGKGTMTTVGVLREREKGRIRNVNRRNTALHNDRMLHNANYRRAIEMNPLAEGWRYRTSTDGFLSDLWWKAFKRDLSEKQLAAIGRTFERDVEYQARKKAEKDAVVDVVEGRGEISGTVVATKVSATKWGSTLKMTVKDDRGFRINGAVPANLQEEYWANTRDLAGRKVKFTGTVKKSDENGFGFFTRADKAEFAD